MAFETKRPMSIDAQIAAIAAKRKSQKAGLESVRLKMMTNESNGLIATMEAIDDETLDKEKHQKALEAMENRRVSEMNRVGMATLEQRLLAEGRRSLQNKFLFEMCYDAHWADDVVKRNTVREMYEAFNDVLDTVDDVVPQVKQSMSASTFLYAVNQVLEATCKKAVARITKESSGEIDPSKISFDLTPEEEIEMDRKLSELGKDEIVELVRDKVLTVIQDEKDAGKEKDEMFRQLKEECEDEEDDSEPDDDDSDDEDDVEESLMVVTEAGPDVSRQEYIRAGKDLASRAPEIEPGTPWTNGKFDDLKHRTTVVVQSVKTYAEYCYMMDDLESGIRFSRTVLKEHEDYEAGRANFIRKASLKRAEDAGVTAAKIKKYITWLEKIRDDLAKKEKRFKPSDVSESVVEESLVNKEPAPDDFYKLVANVMRPLEKQFPKAKFDKYTDASVMKQKKLHSVRVYVDLGDGLGGRTARKVAGVLRSSGFKEGNALNTEDFLKMMGKSGLTGAAVGAAVGAINPALLGVALPGAMIANMKTQRIFICVLKVGFALAFVEFGTTGVTLRIKYKTKLSTPRKSAFSMENGDFIDMTPEMQYMAALEQLKLRRELTARSGETIFESLMMLNTKSCISEVVTEGVNATDDMVMDAAFIQTVFEYTVLETMNTLGLYHFSTQDSKTLRKAIFEAIDVDIDDDEVDEGLGLPKKAGLKSIRINTKKMKQNNDAKVMGKHSAINKKIIPRFKQSDKDKVAAM